jgi:hypothetical protein
MANIYKNAFYDPANTDVLTIYTTPDDSRAIIQNIQVVNTSGSKTVDFYIYDASANVTYLAAHGSISGPTTCNFAKGPLVLEENDVISAQSSSTSNISAVLAILEINRNQQ